VRLTGNGDTTPSAVAVAPSAGFRLRPLAALLVAVAGGLTLAASFPPVGVWPLAIAGPALLVLAMWRQRLRTAFAAALVFGLFLFFPLLAWLVNVAWYVWTALAGAEAVIFAVLAIGQWLLLRLRAWPVLVAGWWVLAEAARDRWPWEGFPWGRLVMSQATAPTARWVAIGGPAFLTFLVALVGACLAWLVLGAAREPARLARGGLVRICPRQPRSSRIWPALALVITAGVTLAGGLLPVDRGAANERTTEVAAIQGNVPHERDLPDQLRANVVTQNQAAATEALAAKVKAGLLPKPDLVIWPENSTDQDPRFDPYIYETIVQAVTDIGRPVLVGEVLQQPQRNAAQFWLPGSGPVGPVYAKRRLVPFGETIPFRNIVDKITSLPSLQPENFTPGHQPVVFDLGTVKVGNVICYEVSFDGLVSSEVAKGANLLTVQSNDADFEIDGQTGETLQQLDMARIRAIEHNRAVVVASITGASAIIAPDGQVLVQTGTWTRAEIEARVPLRTSTTLADRLGGWPEGVLVAGTLAAIAFVLIQELRRRRGQRHQQAATPQPAPAAPASSEAAAPVSSEQQSI
jgi:apolipoprotein N-acyltransferase